MSQELLVCGNIARDVIFGNEKRGGSAPAIAINAGRLGVSSGLLSVVGKDIFSQEYLHFLRANNINIDMVEKSLEELPECRVFTNSASAVEVKWIDNGCHEAMENMQVSLNAALNYSVVHLVSCPPGLARKLSEIGITNLSYEPGPYIHEDPAYLDFAVIDRSKMLFLNEEEYQSALKISGLRSPRDFIHDSNRILIVTKGANGSELYVDTANGLKSEHIEAVKPEGNIIDTTGAGDSYKAGFFAGYIRGRSLSECALIGSYMGAACITQEGGILHPGAVARIKVEYGL